MSVKKLDGVADHDDEGDPGQTGVLDPPEVLDSKVLEGWERRRERQVENTLTVTGFGLDPTGRDSGTVAQRTMTALAQGMTNILPRSLDSEAVDVTEAIPGLANEEPEGDKRLPDYIGRFRVIRELGRGGMGVVYEAEQHIPSRRVALKTLALTASRKALEQFRVEVNATARVVHPGIPQVYEVFDHGGVPVLVMECIHGEHIDVATEELSRHDRVRVLRDVALALQAVREQGVVHRDLKPSNVLLTEAGQPKVLDFGIAALGERELRGSFTIQYAAPEQLLCLPTDERCDVYSLAALAHLVLVGRPTHELEKLTFQEIITRKEEPFVPPPELPSSLAAILCKALAADPDARYASALAFAEDLDRFLSSRPVQAFEGDRAAGRQRYIPRHEPSSEGDAGESFAIVDADTGERLVSARASTLARVSGEEGGAQWFDVHVPAELVASTLILDEIHYHTDAPDADAVMHLYAGLFAYVLERGVQLLLMACPPARYPDQLLLGFRPVGRVVQLEGDRALVPMVQVTHDLDYFVEVDSPLASVLRTHGRFGDQRAGEWLAELLARAKLATPIIDASRSDSPLFTGLSELGRSELLRGSKPRSGAPGEVLIHEGEEGRWLAVVEAGLVEIIVGESVVAVRGQGELIGEMGFLLDSPRTARVAVAAPGTRLTIIGLEALSGLSQPRDREQLWQNLAMVLARKLQAQSSRG